MDIKVTYSTFHLKTKEYTFSAPHGTFYKVDHILKYKASLNRYKITEVNPCILSDNQLDMKNRKSLKTH